MSKRLKRPLISVLTPAYNEAASLPELISRISATLKKLNNYRYEIIVIDDGSTDSTVPIINKLKQENPRLKCISHYRNHGKSLALMQGFDCANGDILIALDADLQDIPELIPQFIKKIEEGYDLANGWRINRRDSWIKKIVSNVFNLITAKLFDCHVHDINCGYKAYRKNLYKRLELRGDLHRLIPAIAQNSGFKVAEIPIEHNARKHGASKFKLFRHRGLLDVIVLSANRTTQIRPFHTFCEMASILFILSIIPIALGFWGIFFNDNPSNIAKLLSIISLGIGAWLILIVTFLPFFGFLIDTLTSPVQGQEWRMKLIKKTDVEETSQ